MPVSDDVAGEDVRWLAGQSDKQLSAHISSGWDLILKHFPPHSSVAIDLRVYDAGLTRVRGIPPSPAIHVVSLLSVGAEASGPPGGSCVSVFLSAAAGASISVAYDDVAATLHTCVSEPVCNEDSASQSDTVSVDARDNVGERGLAVYSHLHARAWERLSNCVTLGSLRAAGGVALNEAVVFNDDVADGVHNTSSPSADKKRAGYRAPVHMQFPELPLLRSAAGMTAAEVTEFNLDRTEYVTWLVATRHGGRTSGLLGEIQLAFLSFLLLRGIGGLTHWGALLREVCGACDGLVTDAPELLSSFGRVLAAQFEHVEEEVVASEGDALENAVLNLCAAGRDVTGVVALANVVKQRFDWIPGEEHV